MALKFILPHYRRFGIAAKYIAGPTNGKTVRLLPFGQVKIAGIEVGTGLR